EGNRTAWILEPGGNFIPAPDFDWDEFDARNERTRTSITDDDMEAIFRDGPLSRPDAARKLREHTGVGRTAAYDALAAGGRFGARLAVDMDGRLRWLG